MLAQIRNELVLHLLGWVGSGRKLLLKKEAEYEGSPVRKNKPKG